MKKFLLVLVFILPFLSSSQNLIPNGDFELGTDSSSVGWVEGFDSTCTITDTVFGPDFWSVISGTPDRLVEGNICSNWSDDTAQSGKAFIHLYIGNQAGVEQEAGSVSLIIPLEKDSSYQLSYYASIVPNKNGCFYKTSYRSSAFFCRSVNFHDHSVNIACF